MLPTKLPSTFQNLKNSRVKNSETLLVPVFWMTDPHLNLHAGFSGLMQSALQHPRCPPSLVGTKGKLRTEYGELQ